MKDPNFYINKYIKILDKNNNIVASGKCTSFKPDFVNEDIIYISFDDKWYFSNKNCIFNIVDYIDSYVPNEPPAILTWEYWRKREELKTNVDVYRDFCYAEIDPPIKPYVDRLNKLSPAIRTIESCCGHGKESWHITILFCDINSLSMFLKALYAFNKTSNVQIELYSSFGVCITDTTVQFVLEPAYEYREADFDLEMLAKLVKTLEKYFIHF